MKAPTNAVGHSAKLKKRLDSHLILAWIGFTQMRPLSPKIIIPTHEFYPKKGGIGVYLEELACSASKNYEVCVWAPHHPNLKAENVPFSIRELNVAPNESLRSVWKTMQSLGKQMGSSEVEASTQLWCLGEPAVIRAYMLGCMTGTIPLKAEVVLILHGSEMQRFYAKPHLRHLFQNALNRSRRIGVVSRYNADWLTSHFEVAEEKLRITSGALPTSFASHIRNCSGSVEKDDPFSHSSHHDRGKTPCRLLTVGRLHPRKGQHAVMEAIKRLPLKIQKQIEYRVVGPVVHRRYYQQCHRLASKTSAQVVFQHDVETREALQATYKWADVFLMTSLPWKKSIEGFGLVYLEAGAMGLPSIAHDTGGVSEAVLHGETGLLVSPDDRDALSDAIETMIQYPLYRAELGDNARKRALGTSWDHVVRELFEGLA